MRLALKTLFRITTAAESAVHMPISRSTYDCNVIGKSLQLGDFLGVSRRLIMRNETGHCILQLDTVDKLLCQYTGQSCQSQCSYSRDASILLHTYG